MMATRLTTLHTPWDTGLTRCSVLKANCTHTRTQKGARSALLTIRRHTLQDTQAQGCQTAEDVYANCTHLCKHARAYARARRHPYTHTPHLNTHVLKYRHSQANPYTYINTRTHIHTESHTAQPTQHYTQLTPTPGCTSSTASPHTYVSAHPHRITHSSHPHLVVQVVQQAHAHQVTPESLCAHGSNGGLRDRCKDFLAK